MEGYYLGFVTPAKTTVFDAKVWGYGIAPPLAAYQLPLQALLSKNCQMAWLLTQLGPQNRKSIQTSFERCFHEALLDYIKLKKPVDAGPEDE